MKYEEIVLGVKIKSGEKYNGNEVLKILAEDIVEALKERKLIEIEVNEKPLKGTFVKVGLVAVNPGEYSIYKDIE